MALEDVLGTDIAHQSDYVLTPAGDLGLISGLANVKAAILHRLVTSPGGLAHRPNYGVGIKNFQNSVNSISTQRDIAIKIAEQLDLDPRIEEVLGISIDFDQVNPSIILLTVRAKIIGYSEQEITFTPFGEGI